MPFEISVPQARQNIHWEFEKVAAEKWAPVKAAAQDDARTISIYDGIGEQWDGSGTTVKRIGAALRNMGAGDVVVNINSPGGNMFEGAAIYNTLKAHDGKVIVNVVGIAASAASIIAMAADELRIAKNGFLMIHNAWSIVMGNRHDMRDTADLFAKFDDSMAGAYADRTGLARREVAKMMDAETFMTAEEAMEMGFADALMESDEVAEQDAPKNHALRKIDAALAKDGMSRTERRALMKEFSGKPGAASPVTPRADDTAELAAALKGAVELFRNKG